MFWKITAYNGTTWEAPAQMFPEEAIELFLKETGMSRWSIRSIINLH